MKQYFELLNVIEQKGTYKPAARENMPGTKSLFGYQFRHRLENGFPILTTKKVSMKNIVTELLWFLKGDTNIKYLNDNGCKIWNEDAYNYYKKVLNKNVGIDGEPPFGLLNDCSKTNSLREYTFEEFLELVDKQIEVKEYGYTYGDCGFQYGKVWRNWKGLPGDAIKITTDNLSREQIDDMRRKFQEWANSSAGKLLIVDADVKPEFLHRRVDQIVNVIKNLKSNARSRRHIVTAIDPDNDENLALYWCHSMFQFNARPLSLYERKVLLSELPEFENQFHLIDEDPDGTINETLDEFNIPKYYLDCQMYQRSADVFLGVPYNIASYALLTHIVAAITNMIPGEFIHTFGDVHIYDNHKEQVKEQLKRKPGKLPDLGLSQEFYDLCKNEKNIGKILDNLTVDMFVLNDYKPQPAIKAKLSTGLK